jgi:hypothetical protein
MFSRRFQFRTAAVGLATALVVPLLPATTATAAPAPAARADRAAGWLAGELQNGRIRNLEFDFVDWGLTLDTYIGLAAADARPAAQRDIVRAVSRNARSYVTFDSTFYAGPVAKLLYVRRVHGLPATVESERLDLRSRLSRMVRDARPQRGRISDAGPGADTSNTIGQSLGVLAFARSGRTPRTTVGYLLRQQCRAGFFRLDMTSRSCRRDSSPADVDATAFGVQALLGARRDGVDVPSRAIRRAGAWLARAQKPSGAFSGTGPTSGSNSNSTGVAAQALQAVNRTAAARDARRWVAGLQLLPNNTAGTPARRDLGAVAYDRAALRSARRNGITQATRDQWRRSTPQALLAYAPRSLATLTS